MAEEHLDDVYRYLLYMTGNPHLAEDLAAETFERALRRWRRFDPRRGAARTWLCQLARGAALDHFRADRRRRKREGVYASDVPEIDEPVFGEGLSPALDRAVRSLSAAEREVVVLRVVLGAGRGDRRARARDQADRRVDPAQPGVAEARGEDGERCPRLVSRWS